MRCVLGRRRLGVGSYTLAFEGVSVGARTNGKSAPFIWTFGSALGVVEIVSSQLPSAGNVAGELLAVVTGVSVGGEVDTDAALGQSFTIVVKDDGLRREFTITSADGRSVTVSNGGKFANGFVDEIVEER
jgi:hypothetical protein